MIYSDFHLGQSIAKSEQNKFYSMKNVDVFSDLGHLKCHLAMVSDSATPNEACISVTVPSGDVYHFSTVSGKTWKQTGGTYSLVNTNANGAHSGAKYFGGYIFYTAALKLGRFNLASTWTDSWNTFTNSSTYRPMLELENELLIGNGKYLASVDSALTFADNALDFPPQKIVSALSSKGTYAIIGTIVSTSIFECSNYLWDGFSTSWTEEDSIPENGVNFFIEVDNGTFAQCGTTGNIYNVNGAQMSLYTNIRETTAWNPYVSCLFTGRAMFGVNEKIFTIHRKTVSFGYGIVNEYTLTTGTVKSLTAAGTQLYASTGSNIDKIGTSYATAVIETPETLGRFNNVNVRYALLNGTIGIETSTNGASYVSQTSVVDSINNNIYFDGGLLDSNFVQSRITLTPSGGTITIKSVEQV